jgi:hypothetical protein
MANDVLHKIHLRAKKIRKAHPGMAWKSAVKQAGKDYRQGKVSGVKGAGKHKAKAHSKKVAGTRSKVGDNKKYRCVHEIRRVAGVTYKGGSIQVKGTADANRLKAELAAKLGEQAGWLDVAISSERTQAAKKRLRKKKAEVIRELNRISR